MDLGFEYCFIPDSEQVFRVVKVESYSAETKQLTTKDPQNGAKFLVSKSDCTPIGSLEELDNPPSDLIKLIHVHPPGILQTLKSRFMKDEIYTSIGPILVALNPFKWITGIYEEERKVSYQTGEFNLSDNPHVFAVANDSYNDLHLGVNQSMIISGESGAGKTEATKQCLNYLAFCAGSAGGIQSKILKASPVLEAWGNAKTLRNNNSSRFGKFIEIWFDSSDTIIGSSNTTYILEKSRVVFQETDERNYHVFYQLLKGSSGAELQQLFLEEAALNPEVMNYINQSGCISIEGHDDAADFREANEAFEEVGFTVEERQSLYQIVAGVLHFGNVGFQENPNNTEESAFSADSERWLDRGLQLFRVHPEILRKALLFKEIKSGGGKRMSIAYAPYKPASAVENKNALCKEIYSRCFDWIVAKINMLMLAGAGGEKIDRAALQSSRMIGILDIFGFEIFQKNSFEQLCINLANEALQQHFNYNIFQAEMDTYMAEDVPVPELDFKDNQDVLDMIMKKPKGLIPMLDEEGVVPRGSWQGFVSKFKKQHEKNPRFQKKARSDDLGVVHYAGVVFYDPELFLVKNKDTLAQELVEIFSMSELPLLKHLFDEPAPPPADESSPKPSPKRGKQEGKQTVGRKFSIQLDSLIANLNSTKPRYIRCIKPNQVKKPNIFVSDLTNEQLTYSGVFEAVIIMQNGYPFRLPHLQFREMYHMFVRKNDSRRLLFSSGAVFSREQCQTMVDLLVEGTGREEFKKLYVGKTKTFYQANENRLLQELRRAAMSGAAIVVQKYVRRFFVRKIMGQIRVQEKLCCEAMVQRSIQGLKETSRKIEPLVALLNRLTELSFSVEISVLAGQYGSALETEISLSKEADQLLQEPGDMMEKFDRLDSCLRRVRTNKFCAVFRGVEYKVSYELNPTLLRFSQEVKKIEGAVRVRRKFERGLAEKDEVMLEEAVKALQELKAVSVLPKGFCEDQQQQAKKIIRSAEELFEAFIGSVQSAVAAGGLRIQRLDDSFRLDVQVDSSALSALMEKYSTKNLQMDPELKSYKTSKRVQQLLDMCGKLCELRVLAENNSWERLWELLRTDWGSFIAPSTSPSKDSVGEEEEQRDKQPSVVIHPRVHSLVSTEIRDMCVTAINYFLVPSFEQALSRNGVPAVPSLEPESVIVDTSELTLQLESTKEYAIYFDTRMETFLAMARDHLTLRQAVSATDPKVLDSTITEVAIASRVPLSHPDLKNAQNFQLMYERLFSLAQALANGAVTGQPGALLFVSLDTSQLAVSLAAAKELEVQGAGWNNLLWVAEHVKQLRDVLKNGDIEEGGSLLLELVAGKAWADLRTQVEKDKGKMNSSGVMMVSDSLLVLFEEVARCDREILHLKALQRLTTVLERRSISEDLDEPILMEQLDVTHLLEEVNSAKESLLPTSVVERLLRDCGFLVKLRSTLRQHRSPAGDFSGSSESWQEVEKTLTPFLLETQNLELCHPACARELAVFRDRMQDNKIQKELLQGLSHGQVVVDAHGVVGKEQIRTTLLRHAFKLMSKVEGGRLSSKTQSIVFSAEVLLCLRELVLADSWEPADLLFFGKTATAELTDVIINIERDAALAKEAGDLEALVGAVQDLEGVLDIENTRAYVRSFMTERLSVAEVLALVAHSGVVLEEIRIEVETLERLSYERRIRAVLLLAASTGQVKGTVDELVLNGVSTKHLLSVVQYVDAHLQQCNSDLISNWLGLLKFLLSVRNEVLAHKDQIECTPDGLGPLLDSLRLSTDEIKGRIGSAHPGFPLKELQLVLNKVCDLTFTQELNQAMHFGRPVFADGKFDVSRVQFTHLLERLETARRLKVRSDRLDRLFFFVELCINLRTAVCAQQWELSTQGEKAAVDRSVVTVKRCLSEYQQACRFFRTPVPGVPPLCLVEEFQLVQREWQRRLIMQGFCAAFRAGSVKGKTFQLSLVQLLTEPLESEITQAEQMERETGEVDNDIQKYKGAAHGLIAIRREAQAIHASYESPMEFAQATNKLKVVLGDQSFLPAALERALKNVDRLRHAPYPMVEEWQRMEHLVEQMEPFKIISQLRPEVDLLAAETSERKYVAVVLEHFKRAKATMQENKKISYLISELIYAVKEYEGRKESYEVSNDRKGRRGARSSIGSRRESPIVEFMHVSTVMLIHYARAKLMNLYDPFDRDWREDKNFVNTPRLLALVQGVSDGRYSLQKLLRTSVRMQLHPVVKDLMWGAEKEMEDLVSQQEMEVALKDPKYVSSGSIGDILVQKGNEPYMEFVTSRLERVGIFSFPLKEFQVTFNVLLKMRITMQHLDYEAALGVLDDLLGNGRRNFELIAKKIHQKNYKCAPVALEEFNLLALETIDRVWQQLAKQAVLQGQAMGKRGALYLLSLSWTEIDRVLGYLQIMGELSPASTFLKGLLEQVRLMRVTALGSLERDLLDVADLGQQIQQLDFADRDPKGIRAYADHVANVALGRIALICATNINWANRGSLDAVVQQSAAVGKLLAEKDKKGDYRVTGVNRVLEEESDLLHAHGEFVRKAFVLEEALKANCVTFTENGLELMETSQEALRDALMEVRAAHWLMDRSQEYWWAMLETLARSLIALMDQIVDRNDAGINTHTLNPGTPVFEGILTDMHAFMAKVKSVDRDLHKSGFRKRHDLPLSIKGACEALMLATSEHLSLNTLDKIVVADRVIVYQDESRRTRVDVFQLHDIPIAIAADKGRTEGPEPYQEFARRVSFGIHSIRISTTLGKLLVDLLLKIVELRVSVSVGQWFEAKVLAASIQWVRDFPSRNEDTVQFSRFLDYLVTRRAVEYHILRCAFPNAVGWCHASTAYEVVCAINEGSLRKAIEEVTEHSFSLLSQYPEVAFLVKLAEKVVELASVLKVGLWVAVDDLERESGSRNSDISVALELREEVLTFQDSVPFSFTRGVKSVYRATKELQTLLEGGSGLLELYMQQYFETLVGNLQTELTNIQLEHRALKVFEETALSGCAGELIVRQDAGERIRNLVRLLDAHSSVVNKSVSLKQALQASKLLDYVIQSHLTGNLVGMCKYVDVLIFLDSLDPPAREFTVADLPKFKQYNADELLKLNDASFGKLFAQTPVVLTEAATSTPKMGRKQIGVSFLDSRNSRDTGNISKSFVFAVHSSFSGAIKLRKEVAGFLELLRHHCVLEMAYQDFSKAIQKCPAAGVAGEIQVKDIEFQALETVSVRLQEAGIADSRLGAMLTNAAECLKGIRRGQLEEDEALISGALEQGRLVLMTEKEFVPLEHATFFANVQKHFLLLAMKELELADADLKQRHIIRLMQQALATPGIPTSEYPFNDELIELEPLETALEACKVSAPSCKTSRNLHKSTEVLLKLRRFTLECEWDAMRRYLREELDQFEVMEIMRKDHLKEFRAAQKVCAVEYALELAMQCYEVGRIAGTADRINLGPGECESAEAGTGGIEVEGVKMALDAFEDVWEEWVNEPVQQHIAACQQLLFVRTQVLERQWETLYDALLMTLKPFNLESEPFFPDCLDELHLAFDHCAFMIAYTDLMDAVGNGKLKGRVGNVVVSDITIANLRRARHVSQNISFQHPVIQRLESTVELLFRVRKAQLLGAWISHDKSINYLPLLGENFYPKEVANREAIRRETITGDDFSMMSDPLFDMLSISDADGGESVEGEGRVETVEAILTRLSVLKANNLISEEAYAEVDLSYDEMRYRQLCSELIHSIYTPGVFGVPGAIDITAVATNELKSAVNFAQQYPSVYQHGICWQLLRDATFLLEARSFRLDDRWGELNSVLAQAEEQNAGADYRLELDDDSVVVKRGTAVLPPVWEELQLIKYDSLFQVCLASFAREMSKSEEMSSAEEAPDGDDSSVTRAQVDAARIAAIKEVLRFTMEAAEEYPSHEFERLIEAEDAALELRRFRRDEPNKSPQDIINRVARVKKRDKAEGVACFMALLIYDISSMSNVLDFPLNLEIIHREIVSGQKYLQRPVGAIDPREVDIEVISAAYHAAIPSLEIMGTEENQQSMKLAFAVIQLRKTMMTGDIRAVMSVITEYDSELKSPLVADEVKRLRVEMENYDAVKLIEYGLKNGRYLDVVSIAKKVNQHDLRVEAEEAARAAAGPADEYTRAMDLAKLIDDQSQFMNNRRTAMNSRATRVNNRAPLRSANIYVEDIRIPGNPVSLMHGKSGMSVAVHSVSEDPATAEDASTVGDDLSDVPGDTPPPEALHAIPPPPKRRKSSLMMMEVQKSLQRRISGIFVSNIMTSISSLRRAVAVAGKVRQRSESLEYHLKAAKVVLRLREQIVADDWKKVRQCVEVDDSSLPPTALEEINAVREGLVYKECMTRLCAAFQHGAISGLPFSIAAEAVDFTSLDEALETCDNFHFNDFSAKLMIELARKLRAIRKSFIEYKWRDAEKLAWFSLDDYKNIDKDDSNSAVKRARTASIYLPSETDLSATAVPTATSMDVTVEECVDDFLKFQERFLYSLLDMLDVQKINPTSTASSTSSAREARFSIVKKPPAGLEQGDEGKGHESWMKFQWKSVNSVMEEVNLVTDMIKYRKILHTLGTALSVVPDPVHIFMGELTPAQQSLMMSANQRQHEELFLRFGASVAPIKDMLGERENTVETILPFGGHEGEVGEDREESSVLESEEDEETSKLLQREDRYLLSIIHQAIFFTEQYLEGLRDGEETSEELLCMLNSARAIFDIRTVLHCQEDDSRLEYLVQELREMEEEGGLSTEHGTYELEAYVAATDQAVSIKHGLKASMAVHQVSGCLDNLNLEDIGCVELQQWLEKAETFLLTGRELCIGLEPLVKQARVLLRLRQSVQDKNWAMVQELLQRVETVYLNDPSWRHARHEIEHIHYASRFRLFRSHLFSSVLEFQNSEDLEQGLHGLNVDYSRFLGAFENLESVFTYSLQLHGEAEVEACGEDDLLILSPSFYQHPLFSASKALLRLLHSVFSRRWFEKSKINDCMERIPQGKPVDVFLRDFFGLDDFQQLQLNQDEKKGPAGEDHGGFYDNFDDEGFDDDEKDELDEVGFSGDFSPSEEPETVFWVLLSTDWSPFPQNVRRFFDRSRDTLLNVYVRRDLKYFCLKGAASLDEDGNVILSELYLKFLQLTLSDAARAENISMKLLTGFKWTSVTKRWLECGRVLSECRQALVEGQVDSLVRKLRLCGLMCGCVGLLKVPFSLVYVQQEMLVFERYALGFQTAEAVRGAVAYLKSCPLLNTIGDVTQHSMDEVRSSPVMDRLGELVREGPLVGRDTSPYHASMLLVAQQLVAAVQGALEGGPGALEKVSRECLSTLESTSLFSLKEDFEWVFNKLHMICEWNYKPQMRLKRELQETSTSEGQNTTISDRAQLVQKIISSLWGLKMLFRPAAAMEPTKRSSSVLVSARLRSSHGFRDMLAPTAGVAAKAEVTLDTYHLIEQLYESLLASPEFQVCEPQWTIVVALVLHFLREGVKQARLLERATGGEQGDSFTVGNELLTLLMDVNLVDLLQPGCQRLQSPSLVVLSKHLLGIKFSSLSHTLDVNQYSELEAAFPSGMEWVLGQLEEIKNSFPLCVERGAVQSEVLARSHSLFTSIVKAFPV